jgi:hypothetical protein
MHGSNTYPIASTEHAVLEGAHVFIIHLAAELK